MHGDPDLGVEINVVEYAPGTPAMAIYELWDMETRNLVGTYESQEAALEMVRNAVGRHGVEHAESLALGSEDARGNVRQIAAGQALTRLATATKPHRGTLPPQLTNTSNGSRAANGAVNTYRPSTQAVAGEVRPPAAGKIATRTRTSGALIPTLRDVAIISVAFGAGMVVWAIHMADWGIRRLLGDPSPEGRLFPVW